MLLVLESRVGVAVVPDSLETCMRSCRSSAGMRTGESPWFGARMLEKAGMFESDRETM